MLAPSPARLAHLHAAARDEVHEDWWDSYYFGAFARLEPGAFDAGWWRLDSDDPDDTHGLLFDAAYGPPPELASPPEPPVPSAPPEPSSVLRSPPDVAQPGAVVGAGA